MVLKTGL